VGEGTRPDRAGRHARVLPDTTFRGREDRILHQVGNSLELGFLLPHLRRHGGVVTLHDACQHDVTYGYFKRHKVRFLIEAFRSLDPEARSVLFSEPGANPFAWYQRIVGHYKAHPEKRRLFTFSRFILRHADRLVVHSRFLAGYARSLHRSLPITILHHGIHAAAAPGRAEARALLKKRFGVPVGPRTAVFLSFGTIQEHKRITGVLEAFRDFVQDRPDAVYVIVGPKDQGYDVDGVIRTLGLEGKVAILDSYLPMDDVNVCIAAADLCFNLRYPSLGSSSGALYKIFAVGRPAVVTSGESMDEFPHEFSLPVPTPHEGEREALVALMLRFEADRTLSDRCGAAARRFAERECSWSRIAERYEALLEGRPETKEAEAAVPALGPVASRK
jgi:glycosyltransferase involved in cell wall biosynthesis